MWASSRVATEFIDIPRKSSKLISEDVVSGVDLLVKGLIGNITAEMFFAVLATPDFLESVSSSFLGSDAGEEQILQFFNVLSDVIRRRGSEYQISSCLREITHGSEDRFPLYDLARSIRRIPEAIVKLGTSAVTLDSFGIEDGCLVASSLLVISESDAWALLNIAVDKEYGGIRVYCWSGEDYGVIDPLTNRNGVAKLGVCSRELPDPVLNLAHAGAAKARHEMFNLMLTDHQEWLGDIRTTTSLPAGLADTPSIKRLSSLSVTAQRKGVEDFFELLLLKGFGARTLELLARLASCHSGAAIEFSDEAKRHKTRFSKTSNARRDREFSKALELLVEVSESLASPEIEKRTLATVRRTRREILKSNQKIKSSGRKRHKTIEACDAVTNRNSKTCEPTNVAGSVNSVVEPAPTAASPIRRRKVKISKNQLSLFVSK